MTTLEFIQKHLYTNDGQQRTCSSVFTDGSGNFYSYGYHYPLIIKRNHNFFVNDRGYSVTTGRHINWALAAVGYDQALRVNLSYGTDLQSAVMSEIQELQLALPKLRKNAFRKREYITDRLQKLYRTLKAIMSNQTALT